jgi:Family of unknown function (DUF6452)
MKKIIVLLIVFFVFFGCEKDDICDATTSTTPRLVIRFYDIDKGTEFKSVKNLKVIGKGKTEGIIFNSSIADDKYLTNSNTISLPLDINNNLTEYSFTLNFGDATLANIDHLKFDYVRNTVYVSRACGFKTTFQLNSNTPTHTDNTPSDGNWIKYISVEKSNIENENETHLKIFF